MTTPTPLPIDAHAVLHRWLRRRGYVEAAAALHRNSIPQMLALVPKFDHPRARILADALLVQRQLEGEVQREPALREAHALRKVWLARRAWVREARQLLLDTRTGIAHACRAARLPTFRVLPPGAR